MINMKIYVGINGYSFNYSEWAVSYHGTKMHLSEPISKDGLKPGQNSVYGV